MPTAKTKTTKNTTRKNTSRKTSATNNTPSKRYTKVSKPLAAAITVGAACVLAGIAGLITYFALAANGHDMSAIENKFIVPRVLLSVGLLISLVTVLIIVAKGSKETSANKRTKEKAFLKTKTGRFAYCLLVISTAIALFAVIAVILSPILEIFGFNLADHPLVDAITSRSWLLCFFVLFYYGARDDYENKQKGIK